MGMTTEIATLGIEVKTDGVKAGADALDKLKGAGERAERSTVAMSEAAARVNAQMGQMAQKAQNAGTAFTSINDAAGGLRKVSDGANAAAAEVKRLAINAKSASESLMAAFETLKIRNTSSIVSDAKSIREALNSIKANGSAEEIARASIAARTQMAKLRQEFDGVKATSASAASGSALAWAASFASIGAIAGAVIKAADAYTLIDSRLRLVSSSAGEAAHAQSELYKVAQDTRQSFPELADTYARIARSSAELGLSQSRLIGISATLSQAMAVSGGSAESARAAMMQLGQGFASGTLRGEELNSVMEQTPRVAQAIAEGLGVTIGELRRLGAAGELTSEKIIGALEKSAPAVAEEFRKMTPTIASSFTTLGNSAANFIDKLNDATKASKGLYNVLAGISKLMDGGSGWVEKTVSGSRMNVLEQSITRLEAQLKGMDARDPRRSGMETQLFSLRGQSMAGGADQPVLKQADKGASAAYVELMQKMNGVSQDFYKSLNVLNAEYQRTGDLKNYRAEVEKLIATETNVGKDSAKSPRMPKAPKAAKENENAGFDLAAAKSYESSISGIIGAQLAAEKSTISLNGAQAALYDLMRSSEWERMPDAWQQVVIAETAAATEAINAADQVKRLNDMLGQTESSGIEKARSDMELLVKALDAGTISEQQYLDAATARLDLTADKTKEVTSDMDEFAKSAAKNMQSSFADFLFDPFGDGTKSMASNFAKALQRMAADAASAKLMAAIFGDGKDNKGAISGFDWSSLFSGFSGSTSSSATGLSTLPSGVLQSFDVGTDYVPQDMIAKIHKGERIVPAKFNPANGGGNVSVEINNYSGQKVEQKEVQDGRGNRTLQIQIGEAVAAEMLRSGSAANKAMRQPRMVAR